MPVETSAPVAGQTKTSVPMVPSVTRPAQQNETAEKASCSGQGLFCKAGPPCSVTRYALVCPARLLRRQGITNIKGEAAHNDRAKWWSPIGAHIEFLARSSD